MRVQAVSLLPCDAGLASSTHPQRLWMFPAFSPCYGSLRFSVPGKVSDPKTLLQVLPRSSGDTWPRDAAHSASSDARDSSDPETRAAGDRLNFDALLLAAARLAGRGGGAIPVQWPAHVVAL